MLFFHKQSGGLGDKQGKEKELLPPAVAGDAE